MRTFAGSLDYCFTVADLAARLGLATHLIKCGPGTFCLTVFASATVPDSF